MKEQGKKSLYQNKQKTHYIHFNDLSEIVNRLGEASGKEIFQIICQILHKYVNVESAAIASFDSKSNNIQLEVFVDKTKTISFPEEKNNDNICYAISDRLLADYNNVQIVDCEDSNGCLIELFPNIFSDIIESNQKKFYRLSWIWENELLAVGFLQLPKKLGNEIKEDIKSFLYLLSNFLQQKRTEKDLKYAKVKLDSISNTANDATIVTNKDLDITSWNSAAESMFKYSQDEIKNKSLYTLFPKESIEKHSLQLNEVFENTTCSFTKKKIEIHGIRKNKTIFPIELSVTHWCVDNKSYYTFIINDITERKIAEDRLKASINEKVTLLQEIHHRVKNNMQSISSLLYLQAKKVSDTKTKELFNECMNRVRSMSLIHEKLYRSADYITIYYLQDYIKDLIKSLYLSYRVDYNKIKFDVHVDDISLYIDFAIPLGLAINELVSNSIKHAFPPSWEGTGEIKISLTLTDNGMINFNYKDNGVGLPKDIDLNNTESLGLSLITGFVTNQLGGSIKVKRDKGTEFQIIFNKNKRNHRL